MTGRELGRRILATIIFCEAVLICALVVVISLHPVGVR